MSFILTWCLELVKLFWKGVCSCARKVEIFYFCICQYFYVLPTKKSEWCKIWVSCSSFAESSEIWCCVTWWVFSISWKDYSAIIFSMKQCKNNSSQKTCLFRRLVFCKISYDSFLLLHLCWFCTHYITWILREVWRL